MYGLPYIYAPGNPQSGDIFNVNFNHQCHNQPFYPGNYTNVMNFGMVFYVRILCSSCSLFHLVIYLVPSEMMVLRSPILVLQNFFFFVLFLTLVNCRLMILFPPVSLTSTIGNKELVISLARNFAILAL